MKKIVFCCGNIREVFTYPEGVKPSEVDADFNKWCEKTGCEWRMAQTEVPCILRGHVLRDR